MPMHHVALNNSVKVAKLLIGMGGNVNHKDTVSVWMPAVA